MGNTEGREGGCKEGGWSGKRSGARTIDLFPKWRDTVPAIILVMLGDGSQSAIIPADSRHDANA